jgi:hypothetical protein
MDCISLATITRFIKAAHILVTQFGWGILLWLVVITSRSCCVRAGYLPRRLGLADIFRSRAYTRHGAKYVARLQGGALWLILV